MFAMEGNIFKTEHHYIIQINHVLRLTLKLLDKV